MKSMSWTLFEKNSYFLQECQACGFSTRSPSIYRRHSRHCVMSNSAAQSSQDASDTSPVLEFSNISSKPSTDIPNVHSKPNMDSVDVSSNAPATPFKLEELYSCVSDNPASDSLNISSKLTGEETRISGSAETGRSAAGTSSYELQQLPSNCLQLSSHSVHKQSLVHLADNDRQFSTCSCSEFCQRNPLCAVSSSQQVSDMTAVLDLPDMSSQPSMDIPELYTDFTMPAVDFPNVKSMLPEPVSCSPALHFDNIGSVLTADDAGVSECPDIRTLAMDTSFCEQMQAELASDSCQSPLVSVLQDKDFQSATSQSWVVSADVSPSTSIKTVDHRADVKSVRVCSNESSSDAVNNVTDSSSQLSDDTFDSEPHLSSTANAKDTLDEMKDDSRLESKKEADSELDTGSQLTEKTVAADGIHAVSSPGSAARKVKIAAKKSSRARKTSPAKRHCCKHCKSVLSNRLERRIHMQTKHPDKIPVFRCADCSYFSMEHKNYERHLLRHLLAGPYSCDKCTFSSTSQSCIKRHVALQHSDQSENVDSSEIPSVDSPLVSEVLPTVAVDSRESENSASEVLLPSPDPDSGASRDEKLKDSSDNDSSAGNKMSAAEPDSSESKADIAVEDSKAVGSSKDTIRSIIEVEVRNYRDKDSGKEETRWTCMSCGARYDERAKVRRHIKCKHGMTMTECRLHDLRTVPPAIPNSCSVASDFIQKLQEARSSDKAPLLNQPSATSKQIVVGKEESSVVSFCTKLPPKSFVKIAPKPIQLNSSCQAFTKPPAIVSSKKQVVLPKRNWKQMSFSLKPATIVSEPTSSGKDSAIGTYDSESELLKHLMDNSARAAILQEITRKEPEKDVTLIPVAEEVPKKRRLILRAKTNTLSLDPCSSTADESAKVTDSASVGASMLPSDYGNGCEGMASEEPITKVFESADEGLDKKSELKRHMKRTSPLKCAHCQFTCFRLPDLRRHLLGHTGDRVYLCGICHRTFRNKIGLYLHEQRKHKEELADTAQKSSADESALVTTNTEPTSAGSQELENSTGGSKSKKKSKQNKSLGSQLKEKLGDQETHELQKLPDSEQSTGNNVDEYHSADGNAKNRSGKEWKSCTETVEIVQSSDELDHFKIVIRRKSSVGEEILEMISGVNNGMMCRFCGYMAKIPAQLTQHMKIHTGERDYWCSIGDCTYRTIWRCDMKRHFKKFHAEEVEQHGGNYYDLLQRSYRPGKATNTAESVLPTERSKSTASIFKMSKRQRGRLLKLQSRERSGKHSAEENVSQKEASSVESSSDVAGDDKKFQSAADLEAKDSVTVRSAERYRPYKCSECGRRSNWRWDLKKHIEAVHNKAAVIIKLNADVARATFADIFTSQGGRHGIRFPRRRNLSASLLPRDGQAEELSDGSPQTEEPDGDADGKKPMSELEKTLARAPGPAKSIGMIDMLRLKRFQCSTCPYRSNHRADLGRHIRMRHGRGNSTINVLSADVASATLQAYRQQWNRKKAWNPKPELPSAHTGKTLRKFRRGRGAAETKTEVESEAGEEAQPLAAEPEPVDDASSRKQHHKEFWSYPDDGTDETKCCDICPFKTDRTGLLELHKLRHRAPAAHGLSSTATYSCPHCPYFVRTSRQLERHVALHEDMLQSHHEPLCYTDGIRPLPHCGSAKTRYVCEKCPFVSMFRNEYWLHRRHHFTPKLDVPYSCDLCPFWASDRRTMCDHSGLHSHSYYPRISVPVISCYRSADVPDNGTDGGICTGGDIVNSDGSATAEVVDCTQSDKIVSDNEMDVDNCPQLEAVNELMDASSEAAVPECCPLLEPEGDLTAYQQSDQVEAATFPTLRLELSSSQIPSSPSTGVNDITLPPETSLLTNNDALTAANHSTSSAVQTEVNSQIPDDLKAVESTTGALDSCGMGSDVVGAAEGGMATIDHTEAGEMDADVLPAPGTSGAQENNSQVESGVAKRLSSETCKCALQCPYCFFAVASVQLLRQHIVFHVAVSDAVLQAPVFGRQLDEVEDGRMDDVRCVNLVQPCNPCRRFAELENSSPVFTGENSDLVAVSELEDKSVFLSKLLLHVV